MNRWGFDEVSGTVIGEISTKNHYSYYCLGVCIGSGKFDNDKQAEENAKSKYPESYKIGIEMRCFNR